MDCNQVGHATALGVGVTHGVAGGLWRDHPNVQICARHHLVVVHVKAVCECQRSTLLDVGFNVVAVDVADLFIGQQNHDHVACRHRVIDFHHGQTGFAD